MKRIMSLLICIVMLTSLTACSSSSEISLQEDKEEVEIIFSWWGTDTRHQYTMQAIKAFEEKYPNIKVKLEYGESTGYDTKTDVKMAAKTEADIMQINFAWMDKYSSDGMGFYNLEELPNLDLTSYSEDILEYGRSSGVLNALPIALNSKVFAYNKTVYDEFGLSIPETWEDLFAAAKVMNKKGVYPLELDEAGAYFACIGYVEQVTGKTIYDSNNKFAFGVEEVQMMIEFYLKLVEEGVVVSIADKAGDGFANGIYAGNVQWITNAEKNQQSLEKNGQELVIGEIPVLSGASTTGWYSKPASMYAVSVHTEHPEEVGLLLDFLVNGEVMALLQGMEKGVPVSSKAKEILSSNNMLEGIQNEGQTILDATETKIAGSNLENTSVQSALKLGFDNVLYANMPIEEAAQISYAEMINALK